MFYFVFQNKIYTKQAY